MRKKSKENKQTLAELNSAHCRSLTKCDRQLVQTSCFKRIELFLFLPYTNEYKNRGKSACMREPRPSVKTSLRSVCTHDLGQDPPIRTSCLVNKSYVMIYVSDHLSILIVSTDAN